MGFELDTTDMERHKVELRMALDKARRRFEKAKMEDLFEDIVKRQLPMPASGPNVLAIDRISNEENQRLKNFLRALIERCQREDQFALLQDTLRYSLQESRRRSISMDPAAKLQPMCLFCANHLDSAHHYNGCNNAVVAQTNPSLALEQANATINQPVQAQSGPDVLQCIRGPDTPIETPSPDPEPQPENLSYRAPVQATPQSQPEQPPQPQHQQQPQQQPVRLAISNPGIAHQPNLAAHIVTNASRPQTAHQQAPVDISADAAPTYTPEVVCTSQSNLNNHLRQMEVEDRDSESLVSEPTDDNPNEDSMQADFFENEQREDEFQRVSTPKPGNESQSLTALVDFSDKAAKFGPFQPFRTETGASSLKRSIDALAEKLKLRAQSPSVPTHSRLIKAPRSEAPKVSIVINKSVERPPPPLTPPQVDGLPQPLPATDKPHLSARPVSRPTRMSASQAPAPATVRSTRYPSRAKGQAGGYESSSSSGASSQQPTQSAASGPSAGSKSATNIGAKPKRVKHKHTPRRGAFRSSTQPAMGS